MFIELNPKECLLSCTWTNLQMKLGRISLEYPLLNFVCFALEKYWFGNIYTRAILRFHENLGKKQCLSLMFLLEKNNFQKQIIMLSFLFTYFHVKVKRVEHTGVRKPQCGHEVKYTSITFLHQSQLISSKTYHLRLLYPWLDVNLNVKLNAETII